MTVQLFSANCSVCVITNAHNERTHTIQVSLLKEISIFGSRYRGLVILTAHHTQCDAIFLEFNSMEETAVEFHPQLRHQHWKYDLLPVHRVT